MEDAPEDVAQRLYRLPPDQFVAARDEEVEHARQAGDRPRADAIGKLRKPTLAAWLVNLLALEEPERLADLLELGAQLRAAQQDLRGDDLRRLSGKRREMVGELVREVRQLAIRAGRSARENLPLTDVEATLGAALADAGTAETVRAGRLTKAVDYAGFGEAPAPRPKLRVIDGGGEPAPPATAEPRAQVASAPVKPAPLKAEPDRTALVQAKAELKEATAAEKDAARDLTGLTEELEALKERQAAAQIALRAARLRMRQAERAVERLERRR